MEFQSFLSIFQAAGNLGAGFGHGHYVGSGVFTTQNYPGSISKLIENEEGDIVVEGSAGTRKINKGANIVSILGRSTLMISSPLIIGCFYRILG